MSLTQLETYGATYDLDDTTYNRIKSGLDAIRENSGWENFKIPEYIWDKVNQTERDIILIETQKWYYTLLSSSDFEAKSLNQSARFALTYAICLYLYWFAKLPDDDAHKARFEGGNHKDLLTAEYNFPVGALRDVIDEGFGPGCFTYITDFDDDEFYINVTAQWWWFAYFYMGDGLFRPLAEEDFTHAAAEAQISYRSTDDPPPSMDDYHASYMYKAKEDSFTDYDCPEIGGTGDWIDFFPEVIILSLLEKYGKLDNLSYSYASTIINGMDKIRTYDNWSNFLIPEYVWDFISASDRNEIIENVYTWYYVNRSESDFTSLSLDQEARFALTYAFCLYQRWWAELTTDTERNARLQTVAHCVLIESEFNIPSDNIEIDGAMLIYDFDASEIWLGFIVEENRCGTWSEYYPLGSDDDPGYGEFLSYSRTIDDIETGNYFLDYSVGTYPDDINTVTIAEPGVSSGWSLDEDSETEDESFSIDYTLSPYKANPIDEYDIKKYRKLLSSPGRILQAKEVTHLSYFTMENIKEFNNMIFKNFGILDGLRSYIVDDIEINSYSLVDIDPDTIEIIDEETP